MTISVGVPYSGWLGLPGVAGGCLPLQVLHLPLQVLDLLRLLVRPPGRAGSTAAPAAWP